MSSSESVPLAVPSPCRNVCRLDDRRQGCTTCWRRLDEIAAWSSLDDAAKREVWRRLPLRERAGGFDADEAAA
jgi:predicted Fe-S protein YdhL (DUF1289 family)